jgi:hypothetical protein
MTLGRPRWWTSIGRIGSWGIVKGTLQSTPMSGKRAPHRLATPDLPWPIETDAGHAGERGS